MTQWTLLAPLHKNLDKSNSITEIIFNDIHPCVSGGMVCSSRVVTRLKQDQNFFLCETYQLSHCEAQKCVLYMSLKTFNDGSSIMNLLEIPQYCNG